MRRREFMGHPAGRGLRRDQLSKVFTVVPVSLYTGYRTALWLRYPLRSSGRYGHPASAYSAVFSWANSAFCLLGHVERRS